MSMSSTTQQPSEAQKPEATNPNNNNAAAAAPRKRRRRAPATGATEDCYACRKREVKCDRRRPYCGQCVELGKECTGYRTTLTWGVGVASRGKLRGMSLPVPKSPPATQMTTATTTTTTSQSSKVQTSTAPGSTKTSTAGPIKIETRHSVDFGRGSVDYGRGSVDYSRGSIDYGVTSPLSPTSPGAFSSTQEYQYFGPTSPIPIPSPSTPMGFGMSAFGEHVDPYHPHSSKLHRPHVHPGNSLQRLHTTVHVSYDETGMSSSSASLGTYSDSDFPSPSEFPQTPRDEFPFAESSVPQYQSLDFPEQAPVGSLDHFQFHHIPREFPKADDISSSISSDQSVHDFVEVSTAQQSIGPAPFPDYFMVGEMASSVNSGFSQPGFSYLPTEGTSTSSSDESGPLPPDELALTTAIPQSLPTASHLSPRMKYLLDYYAKFICPVLVAFDDATNPYRNHVMDLAVHDEGLQYAIAALVTNNMRMHIAIDGHRTGFPENVGCLPKHAFHPISAQELRKLHGEATDEEKHYKATSISLLNQKLVHPNGAQDDSILATLLVLCLFHVSDSGFTKFKTQLAGVQKLLNLRDRTTQSHFIGFIELFFTWFDVMTSTVNDREIEVQGESLDMMNLTANLGSLEHLSGCEGRLFKLIARLGRLNLLSQNRPVRDIDATPRASPKPSRRDFYSFNFDNGEPKEWATTVLDEPLSPKTRKQTKSDFWNEWNDIRTRLQDWQMDTPSSGQGDSALLHMSESFRYAALLYIERLAHPGPSSTAYNFQSLVAQGLYHISQIGITSCMNKFLLWPLFIVGTECVELEHRAMVRQRCIEIQRESGFFNNLSGLEVLEKTWQDHDQDSSRESTLEDGKFMFRYADGEGPFGAQYQAFRWRKAMHRVDGEYIVI